MCVQHEFWTPRRSDRAHVAEHARDDDDDEEDEIVVLRDTGGGAESRNEAVAARVGPARTPPRPTSAPEWQAIRDGPAAPASPGAADAGGGDEWDEEGVLRDAGGGAASQNDAGGAAAGPPRPMPAPAGYVVRDRPTTPATPNTPARETTTKRTRGGCCATRAEARRRGTRPPPPWPSRPAAAQQYLSFKK